MVKKQKKSKLLGVIIILIMILAGLLFNNVKNNDGKKIVDASRVMIIGKENVFVVYEDKLSLTIPFDIQLNGDETIADLDKLGKYNQIKDEINELLPEKIEELEVIKNGEVKINVAHKYNIPEVTIENKSYILTSSLNSLFTNKYYNAEDKGSENVIVDVLNGNGRSGYAGKTGKKIEEALSYKYNAANYERDSEYSYIINKDLQNSQVENLVMSLDEKYIKIKSELDLPTLANAVVILGKEENIQTKIKINGDKKTSENTKKTLEKDGYKNISIESGDGSLNVIEYRAEDYYIAYKISKKIGINNMIEKNSGEKDVINIYLNK